MSYINIDWQCFFNTACTVQVIIPEKRLSANLKSRLLLPTPEEGCKCRGERHKGEGKGREGRKLKTGREEQGLMVA